MVFFERVVKRKVAAIHETFVRVIGKGGDKIRRVLRIDKDEKE